MQSSFVSCWGVGVRYRFSGGRLWFLQGIRRFGKQTNGHGACNRGLAQKRALFRRAGVAQNLPLKAQRTLLSGLGKGALANGCYYGVGMAALEDECSGEWMSLCHYVVRVAALWQTYALRFGHTCSGKRTRAGQTAGEGTPTSITSSYSSRNASSCSLLCQGSV